MNQQIVETPTDTTAALEALVGEDLRELMREALPDLDQGARAVRRAPTADRERWSPERRWG